MHRREVLWNVKKKLNRIAGKHKEDYVEKDFVDLGIIIKWIKLIVKPLIFKTSFY